MKPPLRYAKTVDGGNVAFTVAGEGYPLVKISGGPISNAALEWETPGFAEYYGALAARFRFVCLETRGAANSDWPPEDRKYREYILDDIDAVIRTLEIESCALTGSAQYAQTVAEYATTRPGVASHLIFVSPVVHSHSTPMDDRIASQAAWSGVDPAIVMARMALPTADLAHVEAVARIFRSNLGPKFELWARKAQERNQEIDVTPFLPLITQKTLILSQPVTMEAARSLAAAIPGALLVPITGNPALSLDPALRETVASELERFVYGSEVVPRPAAQGRQRSTALAKLTPREREILALVAAGHSNAEICEALTVSRHTVTRHIVNIYAKLGIHNRTQAAAFHFGALGEGPSERLST